MLVNACLQLLLSKQVGPLSMLSLSVYPNQVQPLASGSVFLTPSAGQCLLQVPLSTRLGSIKAIITLTNGTKATSETVRHPAAATAPLKRTAHAPPLPLLQQKLGCH